MVVPDDQTHPPTGCSLTDDGWHVVTTALATVYASNYGSASHDMTSVIPTPTLRNDYMTQTYGLNRYSKEVAVVAPYDNTTLRIIFSEDIGGIYHAGDTLDTLLMCGQVCQLSTNSYGSDTIPWGFSGTRFHSSRPVAIFQGHQCTGVPDNFMPCDHLYEQCIPIDYWGKRFLVMPTIGRTPYIYENRIGDMIKITSLEDNCVISINGRPSASLSSGESYTFLVCDSLPIGTPPSNFDFYQSKALPIVSSSPVQVCHYISSRNFGGEPGDPAVVVVPPLEQGVNHSAAMVYNTTLVSNHYINIVIPTGDTSLMTLDGQRIGSDFTATDIGYSYARLTIPEGSHILDAGTSRFLATFYGLGNAESYAYIAGMALHKIEYDLHVDRRNLCQGDTLTAIATINDSLEVEWYLDGRPIASNIDTIQITPNGIGTHIVSARFSPVDGYLQEAVTVHPVYLVDVNNCICTGDTFFYHGLSLTADSSLTVPLTTAAGCDSVVNLNLTAFDCKPFITTVLDCHNQRYTIRSTIGKVPNNTVGEWRSSPLDSSLASQPWDSIVVSPLDTTRYALHLNGCRFFDTVISLEPIFPVEARMEVDRKRLDENQPSFTARDKSLRAASRSWWVNGAWAGNAPTLKYTSDLSADILKLTLVAYNNTCTDTLTHTIPINCASIWVPNIFTPGRPDNTLFVPVFKGAYAESLTIYNRQGVIVARLEGAFPAWDGTCNNIPCPQGVYAYDLRYRTNNDPTHLWKRQGLVTLLR